MPRKRPLPRPVTSKRRRPLRLRRPRLRSPQTQRRIHNLRYQGIAAALAELARAHMERDLALLVLESLGLSIADLKKAGADAYDIEVISIL
jgi:hypothetical protein